MSRSRLLLAVALALASSGCVHVVHEQDLLPGAHLPPSRAGSVPGNPPDLDVQAADGSTLRGYSFTGEHRRLAVVYFGGNGEIVGAESHLRGFARRHDVDVYAVNYRGFGPSSGTASLAAIHDDALRVFDAIAARPDVAGRKIVVYGYSIGTLAALTVAAARPVAGVILQGAPTSAEEVVPKMGAALGESSGKTVRLRASKDLVALRPRPIDLAQKLSTPLLSIHGTQDVVVPVEFGKKIYDAAKSASKQWCPIEGGGHNDIWGKHGTEATACFEKFVGEVEK